MAGDEDDRKTHIERIYGKAGNEDTWVDVEVLDELPTFGVKGQKTVSEFIYSSDKRDTEKRRVEDPEDKDNYVEIEVGEEVHMASLRDVDRVFFNDPPPSETERDIEVHKVIHRGINDGFLKDDERGQKQPPSDPEDYLRAIKATGDTDEGQYLNVEVIGEWSVHGTGQAIPGRSITKTRWTPNTEASELRPADKESDKKAKPVRLDPLQNIVNVSWGGLAVDFGDKAADAPKPEASKK